MRLGLLHLAALPLLGIFVFALTACEADEPGVSQESPVVPAIQGEAVEPDTEDLIRYIGIGAPLGPADDVVAQTETPTAEPEATTAPSASPLATSGPSVIQPTPSPRVTQATPVATSSPANSQINAAAQPTPTATAPPCPSSTKAAPRPALSERTSKGAKVTLIEHLEVKMYLVAGCTLADIWRSLMRDGPDLPGHVTAVGAAITSLAARWEFEWRASSCYVKSATVELNMTVQLPELANKNTLAPSLATSLQKFVTDVDRHEDGHVEISRRLARELQTAIEAQRPLATCDALDRALHSRVGQSQATLRRQHDAYDVQAARSRDVVFPTALP